eukprot:858594_1
MSKESEDIQMMVQDEVVRSPNIEALEKKLATSPEDYDAHVKLIGALRAQGNARKACAARERMAEVLPIPEDLWVDWISDAKQLSTSSDDQLKLCGLYERAMKDYLSARLWIDFAEFSASLMKSGLVSEADTRSVFERAAQAIGLFSEKVWAKFLAFERRIGDVARVRKLILRILAIPLPGLDNLRTAFEASDSLSKSQIAAFEKAKADYSERAVWESKLEKGPRPASPGAADEARVFLWSQYIEFEASAPHGNPSRVQVIYERAAAECFLSPQVWHSYVSYLESLSANPATLVSVYSRAVRNTPYVHTLWTGLMRAHERAKTPVDQITAVCERALRCTFTSVDAYIEVCLALCDANRRLLRMGEPHNPRKYTDEEINSVRVCFVKASKYVEDYSDSATVYDLYSYWTDFESRIVSNIESARPVYEAWLKAFGKHWEVWQSFISAERRIGSLDRCRTLFRRAVHRLAGARDVCAAWVRFERECGTAESADAAGRATEKIAAQIEARTAEAREREEARKDARRGERKRKKMDDSRGGDKDRQNTAGRRGKNAAGRAERRTVSPRSEMRKPTPKRMKTHENQTPKVAPKTKFPGPRSEKKPESAEKQDATMGVESKSNDTVTPSPAKPLGDPTHTAFVVNLPRKVENKELHEIFSKHGTIKDIRIQRNDRGMCRGFAYVEFEETSSVNEAITALHNFNFRDKVLSVQHSRSDRSSQFTVFIRGLPHAECDDELRELFKECGKITEIRRAFEKRGHDPKPFGFVTFDNVQSVTAALALSGSIFRGKPLLIEACKPAGQGKRPAKKVLTKSTSLMPSSVARRMGGAHVSTRQRQKKRLVVVKPKEKLHVKESTKTDAGGMSNNE